MEKEIIEYKVNSQKSKYLLSNEKFNIFVLLLTIINLFVIIGICIISYYLSRVNKVICQSQCDSTFRSIFNIPMYYNLTEKEEIVNYDYLYRQYENCLKNCDNCDNSSGYSAFWNNKYCV